MGEMRHDMRQPFRQLTCGIPPSVEAILERLYGPRRRRRFSVVITGLPCCLGRLNNIFICCNAVCRSALTLVRGWAPETPSSR